ncbi:MAG: zinc-ribbon domain-containing protein [bacterium]
MMYCSHCGKKVLETMRFCPFCGEKVIIPEQDEAQGADSPVEEKPAIAVPEEKVEDKAAEPKSAEPKALPAPAAKPVPFSAGDLFMDSSADEDEFDTFERNRRSNEVFFDSVYREDDETKGDDEHEPGFFAQHWRSMLFVILILLLGACAFLMLSDVGQAQLAKLNTTLPFIEAKTYSKLGYEAFNKNKFADAAAYYEKALNREQSSLVYAESAAEAYIRAENIDKAVEMLKKCVEFDPKAVEPYVRLMELYPDAATRPDEINELIRKGFEETGDPRLEGN